MGAAVTLNDIELMSYRRLGYADAPATEVVTRIRQWINVWQQRILTRPGMEKLRDFVVTFNSQAGVGYYDLPATVRRVMSVFDVNTPTPLRMEEVKWIRENDPGLLAIGVPEVWSPVWWANGVGGQQLRIYLWPTPSGVLSYYIDCQTTLAALANPTDPTSLPDEYGWLLVEAACYEEWLRKADTRAGTARQDLETGIKEMRHWLYSPRDYKPMAGGTQPMPSRLGGWYPPW